MQLPEHRRNVFLYLCAFLQELLSHSNENELDAKLLGESIQFLKRIQFCQSFFIVSATLFGRIFLRDPPKRKNLDPVRDRSAQQELDKKKSNFVHHFLVNDQSDFILGR